MNLSLEDQTEYDAKSAEIRARKEACMAVNDHAGAKKCRQQSSALYTKYKAKEIPELPKPPRTLMRYALKKAGNSLDTLSPEAVLQLISDYFEFEDEAS